MTVLSIFAFSGLANAQPGTVGTGTMGITATVVGTLNLTFVTAGAGMAVGGTGTAAGTLAFGNVSMFGGSVPAGATQTVNGVLGFTISTPVIIRGDISNSTSGAFTLTAALATADAVNAWTVGAIDISTGAVTTINGAALYATNTPYVFAITIPAAAPAGLITNTINFVATSN